MLTVICPVYNEEKYIKNVLDFCIKAQPAEKEIFIIDGASTDATCAIVEEYAALHTQIKLLHNPNRIVPFALNLAIKASTGDVIVRLDAHTLYADDYFTAVLAAFNKSGASVVGGPMRIAKGNDIQNAIGYATSTSFGIGNSSFHFENYEGFTDSVYLGAWKRDIFKVTGFFDENLKRNQDDEFHYRAKNLGYKIYQSPAIKSYYYPRSTYATLFKQYYQYGYFKPLVLAKIKSAISLRHIVPSAFVLYFVSVPLWIMLCLNVLLIPLLLYIVLNLFFACKSGERISQILRIALAYTTLHISYGSGFLAGLFNVSSLQQKPKQS